MARNRKLYANKPLPFTIAKTLNNCAYCLDAGNNTLTKNEMDRIAIILDMIATMLDKTAYVDEDVIRNCLEESHDIRIGCAARKRKVG